MMPARVEPASSPDLDSLYALLLAANLPTDGLAEHLHTALVARDSGGIVGCVALELYGDLALLRSLTVTARRRGQGMGRRLTGEALALAGRHQVTAVYLLTTTAPDFFSGNFGFQPIARVEVPASVQQSIEFVSACPQTAQVLVKKMEP